jgi:signal transduction histidine kinase
MSFSSLQSRLLLAVGALALIAVVGVAFAARLGARRELREYAELERSGVREDGMRALRALAVESRAGLSPERFRQALPPLPARAVALLLDGQGRLLATAGESVETLHGLNSRRIGDQLTVTWRGGSDRGEHFVLQLRGDGVPVRLAGGSMGTLELLLLPSARQGRHAAVVLGSLDRLLVGATAAAGLLALLLTWLLARGILAPVRQLQEATRNLESGRLESRVSIQGCDELAELGRGFNGMAAELERQQRLRRDLTSDVAHELRTPLTAMLCRLEAVQDGLETDFKTTLAGFHLEVFHLARLVDDLHELALAEAGQLRLDRVTSSVAAAAEAAARAAGLAGDARLRLDVDPTCEVTADPLRLCQVLTNLLTNASRYTPADGVIRITARRDGGEVRVEVIDTGSGLTREQLPLVFERFYRTDPARQRETGGSGLGLAIVKGLVEAQGGHVWAIGAPEEGATFGFALPGAESSHEDSDEGSQFVTDPSRRARPPRHDIGS